jgi:HK97 family phage portal protein
LFPWARQKNSYKEIETLVMDTSTRVAYKKYAIQIAISRMANSLALTDFETLKDGEEQQGFNWWLLNFEPNKNQNKVSFWQDILYKMIYDHNGALIVQSDEGYLIVAENYAVKEYAFEENYYSEIELKSGFKLSAGRKESEVIHLTLNNNKVKEIVDSVYDDYGKLIGGTIANYNRGNAMKLVVKMDAMFDQLKNRVDEETGETEYDMILDDMMENRLKGMMSESDSATPLENGLEIEEVKTTSNTKSGASTTRDITATFEDILNIVADAFHIPRGIMKGDVADVEALNKNYINHCVRPLAEQIETELNRKLYSYQNVIQGTKVKVNTDSIFTRDPIDFANAGEALLRIGVYSVNDILKKLGEETIDEPWADEHYVTKNYENVKGGERTSETEEHSEQTENNE